MHPGEGFAAATLVVPKSASRCVDVTDALLELAARATAPPSLEAELTRLQHSAGLAEAALCECDREAAMSHVAMICAACCAVLGLTVQKNP